MLFFCLLVHQLNLILLTFYSRKFRMYRSGVNGMMNLLQATSAQLRGHFGSYLVLSTDHTSTPLYTCPRHTHTHTHTHTHIHLHLPRHTHTHRNTPAPAPDDFKATPRILLCSSFFFLKKNKENPARIRALSGPVLWPLDAPRSPRLPTVLLLVSGP